VRKKEHAVLPPLLWADLDEADPRKCDVKPTIAIESSPGRFVGLWMLDEVMSESLNKRLTYHLGADVGGWDLTQVLRVPQTVNYKYQSMPRVRMVWDDGPRWSVNALTRRLPKVAVNEKDGGDAAAIYAKYERDLPRDVRQLCSSTPDRHSDRSAALWKIERSFIEAGATRRETFTYCRASPWNKFRSRENGDEQLKRELAKGIDEKLEAQVNGHDYIPFRKPMSEVEGKNIDWLWYPYLARGEVTIMDGDPGVGKSYLAQMIAKAVCDGERLPSKRSYRTVKGKVFYADTENTAATVTKNRLECNGCHHMENFYQEEEPFTIDDEKFIAKVYDEIESQRPVLVVFDTINLYIGRADTSKASESTQALSRFKEIAQRFNCSVILIRHLTKGNSKEKALYRGQGNMAFAGVGRLLMTVGRNPEDRDERVIGQTKTNLVPEGYPSLSYTIEPLSSTLKNQDRSKFVWGDWGSLTSDEILQPSVKSTAVEDACIMLKQYLADGAKQVVKVRSWAETNSISQATLYRAAKRLNVVRDRVGKGDERSEWSLQ